MSLVMTSLILGVVLADMNWIDADIRRSLDNRWRAIAADAAHTGLAITMAWARSSIDRTRTTPSEWEVADGATVNPLRSMFESPEFTGLTPPGVKSRPEARDNAGSREAPVRPGWIIDANGAGEFVVGHYGDHIATVRVRLQPFRISEGAPRQYRIGVAGRVRCYDGNARGSKAFRGTRIVADRVLIATIGKEALSRYAALTDIDLVENWAPGERVEGPVHINRGYVDTPLGLRPAGATLENGRSRMHLRSTGYGPLPPGVPSHPVFTDPVSMTVSWAPERLPDPKDLRSVLLCDNQPLTRGAISGDRLSAIFEAPENYNQIEGKAGPILMETPVELPPNSRARLPTVLGLPEGTDPRTVWGDRWTNLDDGVYVFTKGMANGAWNYGAPDDQVGGGIYVRGTVEAMRMAVKGDRSFYVFQVGYVKRDNWPRRCYIVRVDRATGAMRLVAFPGGNGNTVEELRTQDLDTLTSGGTATADLAPFAVHAGSGKIAHDFPAPTSADAAPFNGIIFVDWSRHDPMRTNVAMRRPLTGHILALGDPGGTSDAAGSRAYERKRLWAGAELPVWPADLANTPPEVVCTESASGGGTPPRASRLTILASGDIFIQNHVVVRGVAEAAGLQKGIEQLKRENVSAQGTRDLLGLVSDRQIVVGLAAPSSPSKRYGLVLTAALAALGDPAVDRATGLTLPIPPTRMSPEDYWFRYRGSFTTEGLMAHYAPLLGEPYDVLWPKDAAPPEGFFGQPNKFFDPKQDCYPKPRSGPAAWPYSPIYGVAGTGGPFGVFASLDTETKSPNRKRRGTLTFFGSLVVKKRGVVGIGAVSYDKDSRYDQRLLTLVPPLFPNSVNLHIKSVTLEGLGYPPYSGPRAEEARFLND